MTTSLSKRPTISLCVIAKNEKKNLERFFNSIKDCFDEIIFTDTGSTDGTVTWIEQNAEKIAGCPVLVNHFKWVNDFSKARNHSFAGAHSDYVMWLDLDDALKNREGFIQWRDHALEFADMWFATYNYALHADGTPIVSFVRERVFKRKLNPTWLYPIHEGMIPSATCTKDYAISWAVDHHRDAEDVKQDKSRNITILEELKANGQLDARMTFYYGKELYENGRHQEAVVAFEEAIKNPTIEHHDKLLSYQYGAYAATQCADQIKDDFKEQKDYYYQKALDFAHKGIQADPNRAEYHSSCGDIYLKKMDIIKAIPYYSAAKNCVNQKAMGSPYEGAIYSFVDCYGLNPSLNLSKIYFHLGRTEDAEKEARECIEKYKSKEAEAIISEITRFKELTNLDNGQIQTEDIVFTCPPQQVYEFDEDLYAVKGMGGSETALIEVARNLKELTGRNVKVFNMRSNDLVAKSGVEYISNAKLNEYLSKNLPRLHIAWRHNIRVTNAPTYAWCHDLWMPGAEVKQNFDKIMCLTQFHKDYVMAKQNIPAEKIWITRNGLNPDKFKFKGKEKNPNKLVWMSSPDRGLDQAMQVCDEVRKDYPDIELHVYYGLENLYKYGPAMSALADKLKAMMAERPWVKYHGFTEQNKMYQDVSDAVIWIHPCNFIETSCITAMEMLTLGIFPVTRRLGGLKDTLREAELKGHAIMLQHPCETEDQKMAYVNATKEVLKGKYWEKITFDTEKHSWKAVAQEWVEEFNLVSNQ